MSDEKQLLGLIERGIVTCEWQMLNGLWRYQKDDTVVEITTPSYETFITRLRQLNLWDDL